MPLNVQLLIIDPQNDFCDPDKGTLYVKGAEHDMDRVSDMIRQKKKKFDDVHITLDSHHLLDCGNPLYWKDTSGNHPDPFTIISVADVESHKWTTSAPGFYKRALQYVKDLEVSNRYPLCVWPPHCLIGSPGHAIWPNLFDALCEWETDCLGVVDKVTKGSNPHTEHYSAIKAEVPDDDDVFSQINTKLIEALLEADSLVICGEAGSHCVANTVRDIATAFKNDDLLKKITLLTDAMSPVEHPQELFKQWQDDFINEMTSRGMQTSTTTEFLS